MKVTWRPTLRSEDIWPRPEPGPVVFFNALSLVPGGSSTVLHNYWREFVAQRASWRFVFLRGPFREDVDRDWGDRTCTVHCGPRTAGHVGRYLWERRRLGQVCEDLKCDIYFGPNGVYHPHVTIPQCLLVQDPTPYVLDRRALRARTRARLLRRSWQASVRFAACMGYTSNYMRSLVVGDSGGARERRYLIAYNGIDSALRAAAGHTPRPRTSRRPLILSVSTFNRHKNFETLIDALALLRRRPGCEDYTLRIMGRFIASGPYLAFLKERIAARGLEDAVRLEVDRPFSEIEEAYQSSALFSLTSLCESFGIPALEAMSHGTPVVAGDCCAIPEVCGTAAVLVPPQSPEAVAAAWADLLGNESRYRELQDAGRRRCLEFDWARTVGQWIGVMEELMDAGRRR